MADLAIHVQNVSKVYRIYNQVGDRLKEALHPLHKKYHHDFYSLNNINLVVYKGETLGIVGRNGSGKSTLLKIISGILTPTSGQTAIHGKISALLELGAGFNPEFTGIENVYFNGMIMGYTRQEIDAKLDNILSFADIGEFVRHPVKMYSSGMFLRLAFALAIHVEPDILIIDEALAVGDTGFQMKCIRKIREFTDSGRTLLFVSHDPVAVKTLCSRAILLDKGLKVYEGSPSDIIDFYQSMILKETHQGEKAVQTEKVAARVTSDAASSIAPGTPEEEKSLKIGTNEVEVVSIKICNEKEEEIFYAVSETVVKIIWKVKTFKDLDQPHYGVMIRNRLGNSAFETNTYCMGLKPPPLAKGKIARVVFTVDMNLLPENYSISLGVANRGYDRGNFEEYLLLIHNVATVKVIENPKAITYLGYYNMKPQMEVSVC